MGETMRFWTHFRTCSRYGSHASVWAVGDYFSLGCPGFGPAITEIDCIVHFDTKTQEEFRTPFDTYIRTLPRGRFFRKKTSFELCLLSSRDSRSVDDRDPPRLELFQHCAKEIEGSLEVVQEKLKRSDDFDFPAFLEFIAAKVRRLPITEEEFRSLLSEIEERKRPIQSITDNDRAAPGRV